MPAKSRPAIRDRRYDEALKKARRKDAPLAEVAELLEAAHEAGDARATYALATWYLHGRFFRKDRRRAVALLRKAAHHRVPGALYDLAVCYERGEGVTKSSKFAAELYLQAALHGEKQSVYEVGRCYYYGIGVAKDRKIAEVWFERAEKLGISDRD